MDGEGVLGSCPVSSEDKNENLLNPGVLCEERWSEIKNGIFLGSAHLLGLLAWRAQKEEFENCKSELLQDLESAKKDVEDLKKRRSEDAKANEKVLGIFASQEHGWFNERKKLRQQIGALIHEMRVRQAKTDKATSELNEKLHQNEALLKSKDEVLDEERLKRKEVEEKLKNVENSFAKLTQRHTNEISKQKTAFIELVSNQRQLEAEMSRALRQFESAKHERDSVLELKDQSAMMAQKLSVELVKMRRDLEQKDQILSAMLRKSKLDTAEKQMLLEEVKMSKAKRKQGEDSEPRRERHSLRNMLSRNANPKAESRRKGLHLNAMAQLELEDSPPALDQCISEEIQNSTDFKQLEVWVRSQAEKYIATLEQRHNLEVDAFTEQLRIKDERLEAFRWRLMSMELESKRLQSHIEGLDNDLAELKQHNMTLESLLLNREQELHSMKENLTWQMNHCSCQKTSSNTCTRDMSLAYGTIWSKVKIVKRKPVDEEGDMKETTDESYQIMSENDDKEDETSASDQPKDIVLTLQAQPQSPDSIQEESTSSQDTEIAGKCLTNNNISSWKMDLHALGLSFKVKRLKQQLIMLERLAGKQESHENSDNQGKGIYTLLSLLHKQICRYQSLQGKTDDLCQRMHENNIGLGGGDTNAAAKTKEETRLLEHYLEEILQLQRYMVATGQKLMELQSKIASGFISAADEFDTPATFDMKRFADSIKTLFKEVQRGLEIRISRIIGDLEGTLACDGIIHFKK